MSRQAPDPRQLLRQAGLAAKKSWGQNFLYDQNILRLIAGATECGPELPAVELGAGLGALTYHLLARGGTVVAVERDRELVPLLRQALVGAERLSVLEADAAGLDYRQLCEDSASPPVVCGNLPYQLSSRIMVSLAEQAACIHSAVLMIQREVADRLTAEPGSRQYGLLSVLIQRAFAVRLVHRVGPGAFHPRPKVHSAVVRLLPVSNLGDPSRDRRLVAAARAAFSSRRKTLKNALKGSLSASAASIEAAVAAASLDPVCRAETLSVADFARLGDALAAHDLLP